MQRKNLPPPTAFTWGDKVRLAIGVIILALGAVILWRMSPFGITLQAIVVSGAFIGFGAYRMWLAYTRLKQLKKKVP